MTANWFYDLVQVKKRSKFNPKQSIFRLYFPDADHIVKHEKLY